MVILKLTRHFQDMMQYRGINFDHVKLAMKSPTSTEPTYDGKVKNTKELEDGRTITVIHNPEGFGNPNVRVIITAYYSPND